MIPPMVEAQICVVQDTYKAAQAMIDETSAGIAGGACAGSVGTNFGELDIIFSKSEEDIFDFLLGFIDDIITNPAQAFMQENLSPTLLGDISGLGLGGACSVIQDLQKLSACLNIGNSDMLGTGSLESMVELPPLPWQGCSKCNYPTLTQTVAPAPEIVKTYVEDVTGPDAPCSSIALPWQEIPLAGAGEPRAVKGCRGVGCTYRPETQTCVR